MKKNIITVLIMLSIILISVCANNEKIEVKMIYPGGSPALSIVDVLAKDNPLGKNVKISNELVLGPDSLVSAFTSKSHDVIIAPINLGAKLYNMKPDYGYLYAATISYGNTYLATASSENFSLENLDSYNLVLFGKGTVNDFILKYALNTKNVSPKEISYLNSTDETKNQLLLDDGTKKIAYLVAEPALSLVMSKKENIKIIDLQDIYKSNTHKSYVQAGIYVKKDFAKKHKAIVDKLLDLTNISIDKYKNDLDYMVDKAVELKIFSNKEVLKKSIDRVNLKFTYGILDKENIDSLFNEMIDLNMGNLINNKVVADDFYYKKK